MNKSYPLAEIAKWVGGAVRGDAGTRISGVSGIGEATREEITWLAQEKYLEQLETSRAGAVIVPRQQGPTPMPAILVDQPSRAVVTVLQHFAPPVPRPPAGVHPTAVVAESAKLGKNVAIGPNVVVGERSRIGDDTVLHANVFVGPDTQLGSRCELWPNVVVRERCILGRGVIIHPNTTIGADGYGYEQLDGRHMKVPQIGWVEIGDDVEIGANCAVDRAKFGATRIGEGTKIDNLVQVAHNVQIGPGCLIVAQTGIAGSSQLGAGVVLGGQVGVRDHVTLGDGVRAMAGSGISKDIAPGKVVYGVPAVDYEQAIRERSKIHRLPGLFEQVKSLAKRVDRLEATADDS